MPRVGGGTGGQATTKLCLKIFDSLIATDMAVYLKSLWFKK